MKSLLTFVMTLGLFGCLTSPLLNHANAESNLISAPAISGCDLHFPVSGLCATLTWTKSYKDEESAEFTLNFFDPKTATAAGPFVDPGYPVTAKLWMASMGHGSAPTQVNPALDAQGNPIVGSFIVTGVYFVMPGDWEIWIQLKQGKKVVEQAKVDIRV